MTITATRREVLAGGLTISATAAFPSFQARAQRWPTQPIKVLIGGAAGSVPDTLARLVADKLSPALGQPVVIENRAGPGGIQAIQGVLAGAPDGHTLALATMSQAVFNSYLFPKLPYDPLRDLVPIAPLASGALTVAAHPSLQLRSLSDIVALSRRDPERLLLGVPNVGSPPHVVTLLLARETGMQVKLLNFRSGQDLITAGLRGDVQLLVDAPTLVAPQVENGALHAIAVTGKAREETLPQTPTVAEAGFPAAEGDLWIGLVGPRGMSGEIATRLNLEIASINKDAELLEKLRKISFRPMASTPSEFSELIRKDHQRWSVVIRDAGLKLG